jgi:diadenosine tetraphosphate (Ap4A) HIT family hydrolase
MPDDAPTSWTPRERWDALVRGEGCPLCLDEVAAPDNPFSILIAALPSGYLRLARDQFVPGYCVLISRWHAREPHELSAPDRAAFFDDMLRAGAAVERAFGAVKVNYMILGNAIPHLHAHITPRQYGDAWPGRPANLDGPALPTSDEEYAQRVALIRAALA